MKCDDLSRLILGDSPEIVALRERIAKIARRQDPVLIEGPTGSGKELVAQALHLMSGRSGRYVPFNVCAIPETMFEDTLFGHVRGAFTGAASDSPGYLLEADKGTAFFDEVSGLPVGTQLKLLRALETGEFRPVGARNDRHSDFRVVGAVNEPLAQLLSSGRFRRDLAHRLATFVIKVPPLEERLGDIAPLARFFAERADSHHLPFVELSGSAIRVLQQYDWPGNVRELRNVVQSTIALSDVPLITGPMVVATLSSRGVSVEAEGKVAFQRRQLLELLDECAWNTGVVAQRLSVDRATVYRRMTSLGIPTVARNMSGRRRGPDDQSTGIAVQA